MQDALKVKKLLEAGSRRLLEQHPSEALESFLEAADLDPENPETNYYLGIAYTRLERYELGVHHLEKVLGSELAYINRVHARMILGYVYTLKEDYPKALEQFRGIVKAGFPSAQAHAAIGYILDRMGRFKDAVMSLYRAIEIEPKNANARNSLGYIFAEANVNVELAVEECRKALALDGDNPAYLDSLGWAYFKLGKLKQAKSYLAKALKRAPGNEEIRRHMETVADAAGRKGGE